MTYIRKRKYKSKSSFQVQIRRKGFKTVVKSFRTKSEAKKWGQSYGNEITHSIKNFVFYCHNHSENSIVETDTLKLSIQPFSIVISSSQS